MNQSLDAKLPYDPLKDFAPVTLTAWSPIILVTDAASGPKSVQELIQDAKANPGKLNYGAGTITPQLAGEQFKSLAGIQMVYVPYRGSPPTVQGLLSNDVKVIIDGVTSSLPHVRSGKLRVLANLSSRPIAALPNAPSLAAEAGLPGFDIAVWLGLVAPAGTPPEVIAKLNQEIARIVQMPDVKEKYAAVGQDPASTTPQEFGAFIRAESERWSKVVKQAGIRLE
jgi:tripartite-type tricarboxylate transporter receptor subunit TctC